MKKEQYIRSMLKLIRCSGRKKKEIGRQIGADVSYRMQQGESEEEILAQMGSPEEAAEAFNEALSEKEKKVYARNRVLRIVLPIAAVLLILIFAVWYFIPKGKQVESGGTFDRDQVEAAVKNCITLLDEENYTGLKAVAGKEMQAFLTKENLEPAKTQLSSDWGKRGAFGAIYMSEVEQQGTDYVVCETAVSYENITVTYRLSFDQDLLLIGLYMR